MKKIGLFLLLSGIVLLTACNKETVRSSNSSKSSNHSVSVKEKPNSNAEITPSASDSETTETATSTSNDNSNSNNTFPYSVTLKDAQIPLIFHFKGANVPNSISINSSNMSSVTITGKDGTRKHYSSTKTTIPSKQIRVFSALNNQIRTVSVNTEIDVNTPNSQTLYLFKNNQGNISLATPNYAGNVSDNDRDVMLEVIQ